MPSQSEQKTSWHSSQTFWASQESQKSSSQVSQKKWAEKPCFGQNSHSCVFDLMHSLQKNSVQPPHWCLKVLNVATPLPFMSLTFVCLDSSSPGRTWQIVAQQFEQFRGPRSVLSSSSKRPFFDCFAQAQPFLVFQTKPLLRRSWSVQPKRENERSVRGISKDSDKSLFALTRDFKSENDKKGKKCSYRTGGGTWESLTRDAFGSVMESSLAILIRSSIALIAAFLMSSVFSSSPRGSSFRAMRLLTLNFSSGEDVGAAFFLFSSWHLLLLFGVGGRKSLASSRSTALVLKMKFGNLGFESGNSACPGSTSTGAEADAAEAFKVGAAPKVWIKMVESFEMP
mmetsp:Transcript_24368/g.45756  ORF Transcript_24368/g.45756 Transcript_24368/m.45756 type:complete len:341 (+) Transcript_24368:256-1278(+)